MIRALNRVIIRVETKKADKRGSIHINQEWGHEGQHTSRQGTIEQDGCDLELEIGSVVWFDYRLQWIKDYLNSDEYNSLSENHSDKDEDGVVYYFFTKQEFKDYVRCVGDNASGNYVGFIRSNDCKIQSTLIIPDTARRANILERGIVEMPNGGLNVGDEIIFAKDNEYPAESHASHWIKKNGIDISFIDFEYVFAVIKGDNLEPYGDWSIVEALDDDDEWEEIGGVFVPRKEKVIKGLGVVSFSKKHNKGKEIIYAKRSYNELEFKGNKYYAVKNSDILCELK